MNTVEVTTRGAVAEVRLARPTTKNAIDRAMWDELAEAAKRLEADASVRAVVLSGAGGNFSSGLDLSGSGDAHHLTKMRFWGSVVSLWHNFPKPTVAAVSGVCVGIGMNLALGCDFVVADETARFSEIFAKRGLCVDGGGSWLLPRLIGLHRAKELVLLGDFVGAEQAREMGLVREVVPVGELDDHAAQLADRLAAGPTIALSLSKSLLNASFDTSYGQALEAEARAQTISAATEDVKNAVRAFHERTEVVFRGR
ncbi:enoyl-CoA hydratase/isomerase family protein [Streptomyces hirsutus]|uniref:enoyl-CoA hydratase/isomerase family protein n=1 Tax=Streptomyces hirsutus TaxID=35620 RepID=UPI003329984D